MTQDGLHHLYWTEQDSVAHAPAWILDTDTGGISDNRGDAFMLSGGIGPPTGSAIWQEAQTGRCNGTYHNQRLTVTAAGYDRSWCTQALAGLSPALDDTCCRDSVVINGQSTCAMDGTPPPTCSVDCAELWAPLAAHCTGISNILPPTLQDFLGGQCSRVAAQLQVLPLTTVDLKLSQIHDFVFQAEAGMQYVLDLRVGDQDAAGTGGEFPCVDNLYDDNFGPGRCAAKGPQ